MTFCFFSFGVALEFAAAHVSRAPPELGGTRRGYAPCCRRGHSRPFRPHHRLRIRRRGDHPATWIGSCLCSGNVCPAGGDGAVAARTAARPALPCPPGNLPGPARGLRPANHVAAVRPSEVSPVPVTRDACALRDRRDIGGRGLVRYLVWLVTITSPVPVEPSILERRPADGGEFASCVGIRRWRSAHPLVARRAGRLAPGRATSGCADRQRRIPLRDWRTHRHQRVDAPDRRLHRHQQGDRHEPDQVPDDRDHRCLFDHEGRMRPSDRYRGHLRRPHRHEHRDPRRLAGLNQSGQGPGRFPGGQGNQGGGGSGSSGNRPSPPAGQDIPQRRIAPQWGLTW